VPPQPSKTRARPSWLGPRLPLRATFERTYLDPKTVHDILTLLSRMLNVAMDLGWLARAPRIRKPRIPVFSMDSSRLTPRRC